MSEAIPAGYQLHVTSWENDGDAYGTKVISGLCEEDVHFLISIAKQFTSANQGDGLGNDGHPTSVLLKVIEDALAAHPNISEDMRMAWTPDLDEDDLDDDDHCWEITEKFHTLIGIPVNEYYQNERNFCRVYESHKVYWFDAPATDVTFKFP